MKNRQFKYIFRHFLIWTFAFTLWSLMREFGQEVVRPYGELTFLQHVRAHIILGIVAGILFGSLEYIFEKRVFKHVSLGRAILIGTISYLLALLILISFGMRLFTRILGVELNWEVYSEFMFSREMILLVFYCILVGFFIDTFKQIDKKLGPGNLWKMMKGEFYSPKEDERIFMFLDLKSSTAIAEKLGHIEYSKFLQDCFQDLDVVEKYNAEVYQYVGDEAVLTWDKDTGLINSNCIRAFFEFQRRLNSRHDYYEKKYGVLPEFKAGLNVGKIVIAEVGEIKTEIAYHGDTINTAARIQEQCNVLKKNLLISEELKERLTLDTSLESLHVGDILLKGKTQKVNIYSVESS